MDKKKKVGLITIHKANNYGAVLQAYASQALIENLGFECKIIDYITEEDINDRKLFLPISSIRNIIENVRTLCSYHQRVERNKRFQDFMDKNYNLTERTYTGINEINDSDFDFDMYITGSDQTFNLKLKGNSRNRYPYFLTFVESGKKISFASSMGEAIFKLDEPQRQWLKNQLLKYEHIAVRESQAADFIEMLIKKRPDIVLDPTLILERKKWDDIAKESQEEIEGEYIFFYSVLSEKWIVDKVKQIAKKTGLKVVVLHLKNRYELGTKFLRKTEAGPSDFIKLLKNAKLVLTTSFHATVFAIIENKPFYSFVIGEGNRITSLTSMMKLNKRCVYQGDELLDISYEIAFELTNEILEKEKVNSLNYLKTALGVE